MGFLSENVIRVFKQPSSALWIAACDVSNKVRVARASGVMCNDSNSVIAFIPMKFASDLLHNIEKGSQLSLLAASTEDFESYQLKGICTAVSTAAHDAATEQIQNFRLFSDCTRALGLSAEKVYQAYLDDCFVAIEMEVMSIYDQSPKANAGLKLNS